MNDRTSHPSWRWFKWLYPNLKVKRWFLLAALGIFLAATGFAVMNDGVALGYLELQFRETVYRITGNAPMSTVPAGVFISLLGVFLIVFAFWRLLRSIISVLLPDEETQIVDVMYTRQHLRRGPHIVVIGGGTGLSALLRGLKEYTTNLTAIVTVADDGGSSGRLRNEMGIIPPGDIRNCLVALADTENIMEVLFSYRFETGTLTDHSLGNLLLAGLADAFGDFQAGVERVGKIFALRGNVYPSTLEQVTLEADLTDGRHIVGETAVRNTEGKIERVFLQPADCHCLPKALEALEQADLVVLGPGSLYTSVLPNLLVKGLTEKIKAIDAPCVYVCNIMTEPGETDGYKASDHVRAIQDHCGKDLVDAVLLNKQTIPEAVALRYQAEKAAVVEGDVRCIEAMGIKCFETDLVMEGDIVRHDSNRLAKELLRLLFRLKPLGEKIALVDAYLLNYKLRDKK